MKADSDLSVRDVLYAVYSLQEYGRATLFHGDYYQKGFFANRNHFKGIQNESRRVAIRLIKQPCIICGEPLSDRSVYDHLIPTAEGGRKSSTNIMPLCRNHNSSKGKKDLLTWDGWWNSCEKLPMETTLDILCVYAREKYYTKKQQNRLDEPATDAEIDGLMKLGKMVLPAGLVSDYYSAMLEGIEIWQTE
jgi:hypothetical protein